MDELAYTDADPLQDLAFTAIAEQPDGSFAYLDMNYPIQQGVGWTPPPYNRTPQNVPTSRYEHYNLHIIQHPKDGKVAIGKEKDRKPLDPPPLVQLSVGGGPDASTYLQSPYTMVLAYLEAAGENSSNRGSTRTVGSNLMGTTASSLHRVKDMKNNDIAAFVFPDLAVKVEGKFRLRFVLMVMEEPSLSSTGEWSGEWLTITDCYSDVFTVHTARSFPGMAESTPLTRMFADQGIRLRLRKDSRQLTTKKHNSNAASRLGDKRPLSRDGEEVAQKDSEFPIAALRRPVASSSRTNSEQQQPFPGGSDAKRQRHASAGQHPFPVRQTVPSTMSYGYPNMGPLPTHPSPFFTTGVSDNSLYASAYQPRDSFGSSGPGRIDPQISTYSGEMFNYPGSQPSANPYSFPPSGASAHVQHQPHNVYGVSHEPQLPGINRNWNPGSAQLNMSPHVESQAGQTPVSSSNGSPRDMSYTHTAPHHQTAYIQQPAGPYDQGLTRNYGISTPVTSTIPNDVLPNDLPSYPDDFKPTAHGA